jgi:hypothetical protein
MRTGKVGDQAYTTDPIVKATSANMITFLRPNLSDNNPAINEPQAAPSKASDTTKAF